MSAYLLGSPLARFKKFRPLFYNYCVFAWVQIKNGNILLLLSGWFISSSMKGAKKFIFSRNLPPLVTCKTSKFATITAVDSVALRVRFFKKIQDWILKSERIRQRISRFFTKQINPRSRG